MSDIDECSNRSSSSNESENNMPNLSSLQPFNFEPELSKEEQEHYQQNVAMIVVIVVTAKSIGNNDGSLCEGHC